MIDRRCARCASQCGAYDFSTGTLGDIDLICIGAIDAGGITEAVIDQYAQVTDDAPNRVTRNSLVRESIGSNGHFIVVTEHY